MHTARLVVVENVYFQSIDGLSQPSGVVEARFNKQLKSAVEPYQRRTKVGPNWKPLDTGWATEPGTIVLENLEGRGLQIIPTPEKAAETASRVVCVSFGDSPEECNYWRVPPGEHFRGSPEGRVFVRCANGEANVRVTVYPE